MRTSPSKGALALGRMELPLCSALLSWAVCGGGGFARKRCVAYVDLCVLTHAQVVRVFAANTCLLPPLPSL